MRIVLLACVLALPLASVANAINCQTWNRLGPTQKGQTIDQLIADLASGQRVRQYRVNRPATVRCLQRYAGSIQLDFDDACSVGGRASMQALNNILRNYAWGCVR